MLKYLQLIPLAALLVLPAALDAKTFRKIGPYYDVEVLGVDHRGIRIIHSRGGLTITGEELTEAEKELLKDELAKLRTFREEFQQKEELRQADAKKQQESRNELVRQESAAVTRILREAENAGTEKGLALLEEAAGKYPYAENKSELQVRLVAQRVKLAEEQRELDDEYWRLAGTHGRIEIRKEESEEVPVSMGFYSLDDYTWRYSPYNMESYLRRRIRSLHRQLEWYRRYGYAIEWDAVPSYPYWRSSGDYGWNGRDRDYRYSSPIYPRRNRGYSGYYGYYGNNRNYGYSGYYRNYRNYGYSGYYRNDRYRHPRMYREYPRRYRGF